MLTQVCDPSTNRASRFFTDGQHWLPGLCPLGVPRLARDPLSTTALLPCTATKDVKMCPPYTEGPWAVKGLFPTSWYPVPSLSTESIICKLAITRGVLAILIHQSRPKWPHQDLAGQPLGTTLGAQTEQACHSPAFCCGYTSAPRLSQTSPGEHDTQKQRNYTPDRGVCV